MGIDDVARKNMTIKTDGYLLGRFTEIVGEVLPFSWSVFIIVQVAII